MIKEDHKSWVSEVYDRAASRYGKDGSSFFNYFGERLVEQVDIAAHHHVLDVATGRGAVLLPLAQAVGPLGRVVGIDISRQMLDETAREVRENNLSWVHLQHMDAECLDFTDSYFDTVFCGFALFFLPELPKALSEFKRVLKAGGTLAISTWGEDSQLDVRMRQLLTQIGDTRSLCVTPLWSAQQIQKAFEEADFSDIQICEESKVIVHRTPEAWWDSLWTHGTRAQLEQLSADQLADLRKKAVAKAAELASEQGIAEELRVFYAMAKKG